MTVDLWSVSYFTFCGFSYWWNHRCNFVGGPFENNSYHLLLYMHYHPHEANIRPLQVLPSLEVSFQISPCPSRLQEFLVRMDVVNSTSSHGFQVHQLSTVGHQWEISLLQPVNTAFPSQSLMAGQTLTCFFMLKVGANDEPLASLSWRRIFSNLPLCFFFPWWNGVGKRFALFIILSHTTWF